MYPLTVAWGGPPPPAEKLWLNALDVPLKHATPAQIVNEVRGCYAMKVHHPALQSTAIYVDVLDVKSRFVGA